MAVTNIGLGYYVELPNKQAPNFSTNKLRLLRLVSEDLNVNLQRDESNEVRGDAQSSGSVLVGASGGGSVQIQFSLDTFDDLIVGLLYAPDDSASDRENGWQQDGFVPAAAIMGGGAGAVTFNATNMTFTSTALFTRAPEEGERIFVTGFGNRNLDTVFQVAVGSDSSTIELVNDTGAASIAAYAGVSANVVGSGILIRPVRGYSRNGTFNRKFGLVRFYSDSSLAGQTSSVGLASCDWRIFRGAIFTSIQLAAAPGSAGWTGTLSVLFADAVDVTNATSGSNLGGFQITDWNQLEVQNSYPLANAIQSVKMVRLREVGQAYTTATRADPLSFGFTIANNAFEVQATRNLGAIDVLQGTFSGTLQLQLLYIDPTYFAGMIADKAYEVEVAVADAEGHCQLWRFPKCRYTQAAPNPGKNQVVAETLDFIPEAGGTGFDADGVPVPVLSAATATGGYQFEVLRFYDAA